MATREEIEYWIDGWGGQRNIWRDQLRSGERSANQVLNVLKNLEKHYPKEARRSASWEEIEGILDAYEMGEL